MSLDIGFLESNHNPVKSATALMRTLVAFSGAAVEQRLSALKVLESSERGGVTKEPEGDEELKKKKLE